MIYVYWFMKILRSFVLCVLMSVYAVSALAQFGEVEGWSFNASVESGTLQDFDMESGALQYGSGGMHENIKASVNASRMFVLDRQFSLGINAGYRFYDYDFDFDDAPVLDMGSSHHSFRMGGNVMYRTRLFGKTLMLMGNLTAESSEWGLERITGMGMAMLMLKYSRDEMLGVGLIGLANTTSDIPFFPMAFYRKVFSPQWTLNFSYPFFGMQYTIGSKHTVAAGFTFSNDRFWFKPGVAGLPEVLQFNRSTVRTGFNYDCKLADGLVLTVQTGWEFAMKSRIYRRNGHHECFDFGNTNGVYAKIEVAYRIK